MGLTQLPAFEATSSIDSAVDALAAGHLCAIPTETVYGLAADACNANAIARVFAAKGRPTSHPLIVHIAHTSQLHRWIHDLPEWAIMLTTALWPGPLTIVGRRTPIVLDAVTGGQDTVAVRVPNHPMTLELLSKLEARGVLGLVAPSANNFGGVSPTTAEHVIDDLGTYLAQHHDVVLDGGACTVGVESTIVLATQDQPIVLRPGAITQADIERITGVQVLTTSEKAPRVSGSLASHYAPAAQVILTTVADLQDATFSKNSGFIALDSIATPEGVTRLANPKNPAEFAAQLYAALRQADEQQLTKVYVVAPLGSGIEQAIADRLRRAAHESTMTT